MSCGPCALGTGVAGPNDVGLEEGVGGSVVWRWVLEPVGWREVCLSQNEEALGSRQVMVGQWLCSVAAPVV